MEGGINSALTGMQAGRSMLGASAHNIANALTEGFTRTKATPEELSKGGVQVRFEQDSSPGPEFFIQDENGFTRKEGSNVDLTEEFINTFQAAGLMEANMASFRIQNKTLGSLLDIFE